MLAAKYRTDWAITKEVIYKSEFVGISFIDWVPGGLEKITHTLWLRLIKKHVNITVYNFHEVNDITGTLYLIYVKIPIADLTEPYMCQWIGHHWFRQWILPQVDDKPLYKLIMVYSQKDPREQQFHRKLIKSQL